MLKFCRPSKAKVTAPKSVDGYAGTSRRIIAVASTEGVDEGSSFGHISVSSARARMGDFMRRQSARFRRKITARSGGDGSEGSKKDDEQVTSHDR